MVLRPVRLNVTDQKLADAIGDTVNAYEAETQKNGVRGPWRCAATRPAEEYVLTLRGEMPVRIQDLSCGHPRSRKYEMTDRCWLLVDCLASLRIIRFRGPFLVLCSCRAR